MENSEKQRFIETAFHTLRARGIVNTYQDFAKLIGVSRNSISAAKNGNETYLTDSLISKIDSALDYHTTPLTDEEIDRDTIPILPTDARAGTLAEFADSIEAFNCERMVSPIRGADFAMQVTGDSMSPEYPSGSMVIIKKINEKAFIEWGKTYVLDTENGAVIKIIRKTDDPQVIECVSTNPAYQPFTMETKYINGWYRVLMVLSLK
jgi:phage repressor protein C with HTH and peptisase S24 domain